MAAPNSSRLLVATCLWLTAVSTASNAQSDTTVGSPSLTRLQLNRVISRLPLDEPAYKIEYGWFCMSGPTRAWPTGYLPASPGDFSEVFKQAMERLHYSVAGLPDSVFESNAANYADLQVGASINKITSTICFPNSGRPTLDVGDPGNVKGTMGLTVTWELYSPRERRVIYKATTQEAFTATETMTGGTRGMLLNAFSVNLSRLASDPAFKEAVQTAPPPEHIEKRPST